MSFFKAPSWARSQTMKAEGQRERNIFSHSDNFLDVQKERIEREERRKEKEKEKEQKRKAKQEEQQRRSSSEKRKVRQEDGKGSLKTRRITSGDSAKLLASAGFGDSITISDSEDDAQSHLHVPRSPRRTTRTIDIVGPSNPRSRPVALVEGGDRSENEAHVTAITARPARPRSQPQPEPEEEVDSDPEIAEIQRKARATARLKEQAKAAKSATPEVIGSPVVDDEEDSHLPTPPPRDAAVQLLIQSAMPDTAPLIVWRKLSQPLREVKKSWCQKQGFSEEYSKQICLTYQGRKYYESSTVRRLGISADANGRVFLESDPSHEGVEKIAMEAMTEEMYEQSKKDKERQALAASGDYEEEQEGAYAGSDEQAGASRRGIKLIVKAKDKKECKVQVFNDTSFQRIIKYAKKDFGFAAEQEVYMEFDGERLEPDDQVGNTDLDDMDQVQMFLVK